ncbi:MAG: copper chaperone PCu(A)C [Pseudomonadales bacterium]|nr:copper chaperone PCu(A)C [Pseudomonadales bacterium]
MKTTKFFHQRPFQPLLTCLLAIALMGCSAANNDAAENENSAEQSSDPLSQTANDRGAEQDAAMAGMHLIDARIHAPAPGQPMSAGYFTLMNHGSETVTLTGFASPTVAVQMHTTKVENNGTTMRPLNTIAIAADDQIIFQPGGNHLMIRDLPSDLQSIELVMQFENGASLATTFNVLSMDEWMGQQLSPVMDHSNH